MFFGVLYGTTFLFKTWKLLKKHVPTSQKTLFISSKQWIKKCRKRKVTNQKSRKIVNFSCFFVFCTVRNIHLRHENFKKKHVPTSQKTFFISSNQWIKKCRKKNEKRKVTNQKSRKSLIFHVFFVFCTVRNIHLRHENFWKKHVPTSQKTLFIISKQWIKKCRKKNEKRKVTNQKSRKIVNFSCFLCFVPYEFFLKHENFWKKTCSHFLENTFHQF